MLIIMEHFVAYHSAQKMGYELKPSSELKFLSKKFGLLKKAIGNTVWVVQCISDGKKTQFFLCGTYIADNVAVDDPSANRYAISGNQITELSSPIPLNNLDWFPALLKSQSNFSLGFNRLNDERIIQALTALKSDGSLTSSPATLPDIEFPFVATEGAASLVPHLRRERNRAIIEAKKAATLSVYGRLCCEACNFDFSVTYGTLGEGFCEVHHLVPLSVLTESVTTTLDDLAILCSNCHRIIHRSTPMLSVEELSKVVSSSP